MTIYDMKCSSKILIQLTIESWKASSGLLQTCRKLLAASKLHRTFSGAKCYWYDSVLL